MAPAVPHPEGVPDVPAPEHVREVLVVGAVRVVSADGEDQVDAAHRLQPRGLVLVDQEMRRVVVVDVVVGVAVREPFDVVEARHREHALHEVRMAQREVDRVVRAEARARRDEERVRVAVRGEREQLGTQVMVVLLVTDRGVRGMFAAVVPALLVDAVHAEELEPAVLDPVRDLADHAAVLPLEEPAHRCGEHEDPGAAVPEHEQLHVAPERGAVPLVVFAVQAVPGRRCALARTQG